jgi:aryl-alcohol dehydrogenase-like predicted oxidoreductase
VERRRLGTTDLEVSNLCLGAMNFGTPEWGCDADAAAAILARFQDAGGNFIDTANIYGLGESERILGTLIRGRRDDFVVASKVGFPMPGSAESAQSPESIRASLEATLERLDTDYVDLYQLHCWDPSVPLDETLGALRHLANEGLIRHAGCSNYFVWQIAHAASIALEQSWEGLVSAQMMYSLVRRDVEREHTGYARQFGIALLAYSPLHGGQLAGGWKSREELPPDSRALANPDVYLSDEERIFAVTGALVEHASSIGSSPGQVALAWVLRNPSVTSTLTAARSPEELDAQMRALDLDADDSFWTSLDHATRPSQTYPADFYERLGQRAL